MNVVYLLDPKTQVGYAIEAFETSHEALDRKARLGIDYSPNIFYHRVNDIEPDRFYTLEEALRIVNGE